MSPQKAFRFEEPHPYYDRPSKGHSEVLACASLLGFVVFLVILWLVGVIR